MVEIRKFDIKFPKKLNNVIIGKDIENILNDQYRFPRRSEVFEVREIREEKDASR